MDQSVRFGLVSAGLVQVLDEADEVAADASVGLDGAFCVPVPEGEAYRILRLRVKRGPQEHPVMQVHLRDDARGLRISGVIRVEANPAAPPAR